MNVFSGRLVFSGLFAFGLWATVYAADMLTLVKERSHIEFVGSKPGASHRGGFKRFTVDAAADWTDLSKSSLRVELDTTSLWSDDGALTGHLKNRDFFNVPQFPKIEFETMRIEIVTTQKVLVTGKLKMLDKSVEIAFPCSIEVTDSGLQVQCEFKIDRTQWDMTYGSGRVNDEVEIAVKLVFGR